MNGLLIRLVLSLLAICLTCNAAPPPVYDTNGHELSTDATYYVLPESGGRGGGLTLSSHVLPCPLFVAQERDEHRGLPVRFAPRGPTSDRVVRLSSDVRIRFAVATTCVQTTEWHLSGGEPLSGWRHVVTGPSLDLSGRDSLFRIEKHGGAPQQGYRLVSCWDSCEDLGVFGEGGASWLGVSDSVHAVVFKKAAS